MDSWNNSGNFELEDEKYNIILQGIHYACSLGRFSSDEMVETPEQEL